jgi:hypothetical protein
VGIGVPGQRISFRMVNLESNGGMS